MKKHLPLPETGILTRIVSLEQYQQTQHFCMLYDDGNYNVQCSTVMAITMSKQQQQQNIKH